MRKRNLPAILLASIAGAQASDYQGELSGLYIRGDNPIIEQDIYKLTGTFYFSPVQTRSHPLAETAFLERASGISVSHTRSDLDADDVEVRSGNRYYTVIGNSTTSDISHLNTELYLPGDIFYLGLGAKHQSLESNGNTTSTTSWNASIGITPVKGLLLYSTFLEDRDLDERWDLNARYVTDHFGPTIAIETNYGYDEVLDDRLSLSLNYYFDRTLSVGYQRVEWRGDLGNGIDSHRFNIKKFFGDQWSLTGFYNDDYLDEFGVEATIRF